MLNRPKTKLFTILGALLILVLISACGSSTSPPPEPTNTALPPTATEVPPTDTPAPTDTPVPTDTPIPTDTPEPTETPTEVPTETPDLAATAAVEATQKADVLIEEIDAVLQEKGYSTDQGYLGWAQEEPITFRIDSYNTYTWNPFVEDQEFSSFVLRGDITWESTSGLILCGFVFRAEGEDLQHQPYYIFQTIRLSGWPSWDLEYWKYGQFQSSPTGGVREDAAIKQGQGSTNEYLLVVDGNTFRGYVNGENLGGATIATLSTGLAGFYAYQESGDTTCTLDNAWLWVLEEE